jgi:hypothetical protein
MSFEKGRSTYGPYNVLLLTGPDGRRIESFPYASIKGSQLLVAVNDNVARIGNQGQTADSIQFMAIAEISIWGSVQKQAVCLKRQATRMLTGPMSYQIPGDLPWNEIEVRARNMSGGRRGSYISLIDGVTPSFLQPAPNVPPNPKYSQLLGFQPPDPSAGYLVEVTIAIQQEMPNG